MTKIAFSNLLKLAKKPSNNQKDINLIALKKKKTCKKFTRILYLILINYALNSNV